MEKPPDTSSGGGAAVAVVMILVLLAGFCLVGVLVGGFFFLGVRSTSVPATPAPPAPVVMKTVGPVTRMVVLTVSADSSLTLDGAPVQTHEIPDRIQNLRVANPGAVLEVAIRADPAAPFSAVNDVTQILNGAAVTYTMQEQEDGSETATEPPAATNSYPGHAEAAKTTAENSSSNSSP